jgi:hypothetical protein
VHVSVKVDPAQDKEIIVKGDPSCDAGDDANLPAQLSNHAGLGKLDQGSWKTIQ